jgi:nucleoside-diphosphate-sugar epimerase
VAISDGRGSEIYVEDAAAILARLCVADRLSYRLYYSGGDTCSLAELAQMVREIIPASEINFDDSTADFPHVYIADDSRLRADVEYERPPLRQRVLDHMDVARAAAGLPALG